MLTISKVPYEVCEHTKSGKRASPAALGENRLIYSKWPPNDQIWERMIYWPLAFIDIIRPKPNIPC